MLPSSDMLVVTEALSSQIYRYTLYLPRGTERMVRFICPPYTEQRSIADRFGVVVGASTGFGQQYLPLAVTLKLGALDCASHASPLMRTAEPPRLIAR
jgi:hypothetical protein